MLDTVRAVLLGQCVGCFKRGLHFGEESVRVEDGDGGFGIGDLEGGDEGGETRIESLHGAFNLSASERSDTVADAAFASEIRHNFHGRRVQKEEVASAGGVEDVELFFVGFEILVKLGGVILLTVDGLEVVDAEEEEEQAGVTLPLGPHGLFGGTSTVRSVCGSKSPLNLFNQVVAGLAAGGRAGNRGAGEGEVIGQDLRVVESVSQVHDEVRTVGVCCTVTRCRSTRVSPRMGRAWQIFGTGLEECVGVRRAAEGHISTSWEEVMEIGMKMLDLQNEELLDTRPLWPISPAL